VVGDEQDAALRNVARRHGAIDLATGETLLRLLEGGKLLRLGYSTARDYARERLGMPTRALFECLALAQACAGRPLLRRAVATGLVTPAKARAISPVVAEDAADLGDTWSISYRSIARDGRVVWLQNHAVLIRDATGQPRFWQGVTFDITELKEAEGRIAEAEATYRTLVEQLPVVVYQDAVDDASTALYISPQYERVFGYPPEARLADPDFWIDHLHPEDRERVLELSRWTNETGEPFSAEYRFQARDGRFIWVRDEAVLQRDAEGQPLLWQGVLIDVTARKQAELALSRRDDMLETIGFAAERLNRLQFLTIRGYLTLVFGALVALLMVLTVWQ